MLKTKKKTKQAEVKKDKENNSWKTLILPSIPWIIWWIIWIVWIIISACITYTHEDKARDFSVKKEMYSSFISDYIDYFNNDTIINKYEDIFWKYISLWEESVYNQEYWKYKTIVLWSNKILTCFYDTPYDCVWDLSSNEDKEDIAQFVWEVQKAAMVATMTEQVKNFRNKTSAIRLIMDNDLYEKIMLKIAWKVYIAPSPFKDCPGSAWTNPACWFYFDQYIWEDEYTTTYWFSFIDESVFDLLNKDLNNKPIKEEIRKKPDNIVYQ